MSVTVVGSVALDTVETPHGSNIEGLGGAATYFALAAANYGPVRLVGVVGDDFPSRHVAALESKGVDLEGLERVAGGATFRWHGRYHDDMNQRDTLHTALNVFENFHPKLPERARKAPFLFLGNIHPQLQLEVLEQATPRYVALDTMNLWIEATPDLLREALRRIDTLIINDSEVRLLTGERNLVRGAEAIRALGPKTAVIKKGEHGCLLFADEGVFSAPALPLREVFDPTGAGDSFAGGFMGYLAQQGKTDFATLRRAVIQGSVVASFTCERFGPDRLIEVGPADIAARYKDFERLAQF